MIDPVTTNQLRIVASVSGLLGYLSTAKQENTDAWMDGLAERMNQVYEAFGESDRVRYVGRNVGGWIEVDNPKAVHFDAWVNGGKLHPLDPVGLEYRWAAASAIDRDVCSNMSAVVGFVRGEVRKRLQQANSGRKIIVTLAGECPTCCGTGAVDSGGSREDGSWINVPCECQGVES